MSDRFIFYKISIFYPVIIFSVLISTSVFSQTSFVKKSVNFGMEKAENRDIEAIIIHSTFNNSGGEKYDIDLVIKQFSIYRVCSHYIIGREGTIYKLVDEKDIAFHAGRSSLPNGKTAVNQCSIGIELINSMDDIPTTEQNKALIYLVKDIQNRHKISYILRHSDIAPDRKTDPWNFDWEVFLKNLSNYESLTIPME